MLVNIELTTLLLGNSSLFIKRSIAFGETKTENDERQLKLFSVAEDMKMVEYNVEEITDFSDSQKNYIERLKIKSIYPVNSIFLFLKSQL